MIGDWPTIAWRFMLSFIGILVLAAGLHGYLLRPMPYWERGVAIVAALLLVAPELTTDMIGLILMAGLFAFQYMGQRVAKPASVGAAATDRPQSPHA
jgi:TRAP-type uncharacterized transport system fused permease subunit